MYIQFACESCGKSLRVREENVGKKVKCPHCHHTSVVKAPETPAAAPEIRIDTDAPPTRNTGKKPRPKPAAKTESPAGTHDTGSFTDGTEVGLVQSAILAVIGSVGFYALVGPLYFVLSGFDEKPTGVGGFVLYLTELFVARGWVPFTLVLLMAWSIAILAVKARKLTRQKESMLFDLLPGDIAKEITADNADRFTAHVRSLPVQASESFLVNRVIRGLEHFRVLRSNSEVAARLQSQSDIDATAVDSSYTLLKVFIWAIPILGFIGTVIGISAAVGGFSSGMDAAADISQLKDSLGGVTGGLSTAFDTTLVALVMSIFVMFPASSMQKSEEDLLNWVDEYCNENLLKRLQDGKAEALPDPTTGIDDTALRKAIDAAMVRHHAELETWVKKLEAIGKTLNAEVAKGWSTVDEQIRDRQAENAKAAENLNRTMAQLVERTKGVQNDVTTSMKTSAESLTAYLSQVQEGIAGLNGVLAELGGKQVVVQQQVAEPARRSGWSLFGNGRRRR